MKATRARVRRHWRKVLDDVLRTVEICPESVKIVLVGHTDGTGPDDFNAALSALRAERVAT